MHIKNWMTSRFLLFFPYTDNLFRTLFTEVFKNDPEDIYEISGISYSAERSIGCQSRTSQPAPLENSRLSHMKECQHCLHYMWECLVSSAILATPTTSSKWDCLKNDSVVSKYLVYSWDWTAMEFVELFFPKLSFTVMQE